MAAKVNSKFLHALDETRFSLESGIFTYTASVQATTSHQYQQNWINTTTYLVTSENDTTQEVSRRKALNSIWTNPYQNFRNNIKKPAWDKCQTKNQKVFIKPKD